MSEELLVADGDLVDMLDAVFSGYREEHPPAQGRVALDRAFWAELIELGLARLTGDEQRGGSGATWVEGAALLQAAVRHGIRLPLAENDLLAGWLCDLADIGDGDAIRTVAVLDATGSARAVPWAGEVDAIVAVWAADGGYRVAEVSAADARITHGENLIGEPRDDVSIEVGALDGVPLADGVFEELQRKSALIRAVQVSAALERALDLSVEHATARVQFGRPIAKLQAVQHLLSDIAAEASLARASTESALAAALVDGWASDAAEMSIAVARSCTGHAASTVVRAAHQVHGAIGTTREHLLHEFTRAALAWRGEHGSVRSWDLKVGELATAAGADGLWELIAG